MMISASFPAPSPLSIRVVVIVIVTVVTVVLARRGYEPGEALALVAMVTTTALGLAGRVGGSPRAGR
ncbi:hypothetical protein ABT160_34295 [Streptomyces sp. NPDC001941]|uniref:hypothetical protein n=1 Tax=Streptomyces sp. NPDC001941 TaxID=3154659 RepID=UPI0033339647